MRRLLLGIVPVLALGCGPVQSTAYLLDAEVALEAAQTAGAERYAPFEYTSAGLYLHKAREEAGFSDYQVAVDFARKASLYANQAREKAVSAPKKDDLLP